MPNAAPRRCHVLTHPPFTGRRGCPLCEKERDRQRPPASQRGYGRQWVAFRLSYLASHPRCVTCGSAASQVDHIQPLAEGGALLDPSNCQALCVSCHSKKTRRQSRPMPPMIY
jgi:5-methylcytosine-specific restriction endonuclease McrA